MKMITFSICYILLQSLSIVIAGQGAQTISYAFSIGAPLLAMAACAIRAHKEAADAMRIAWAMAAVAMLLWAVGMALSAWQDLSGQVPSSVTYFSDFVYFVYGVPILLAISSGAHGRSAAALPWLDVIQITLAAYLAYVAIFSASPFTPHDGDSMPIGLLVKTYDAENLALACCATLRLVAHRSDGAAGRYYMALTLYLWIYTLCAGWYNHSVLASPGGADLRDVMPVLPFLFFAILASRPVPQHADGVIKHRIGEQEGLALLIDNVSPIFFTASLLGLGLLVMEQHTVPAMVSVFVALSVYALRTAMLQSRYIRSERALREARDRLEQLTLQDGLTGIANRRCFDQTLDAEWERALRSGQVLSLLMVDIDHFKSLNDHFGHPYGDACLIKIAQALRSALPRNGDLVARYGGEEFAAILPATDRAGAALVASKMRESITALRIDYAPARGGTVTVSMGLAMCVPRQGQAASALIGHADQLLYRAKQNGRDRVEAGELQSAPLAA